MLSILSLGPVAFGSTRGIITYLQGKNVLASRRQCPCGTPMELEKRKDISDKHRWRCPTCHKGITIRENSFFQRSKLTLQKWLVLINWWARQCPVTDAAQEEEVTEATAIQVHINVTGYLQENAAYIRHGVICNSIIVMINFLQ